MTKTKPISLAELQAKPLPKDFSTISGPLPHTLLNDLMFRIVFEANQDALKSLLCSLLHLEPEEITSLEIKNPIQLGEHVDDKTCIFDLYVLLNNQKQVHLELQVLRQSFWTNRSLRYLCKSFGKLNAGDNYNKLLPLIQIDILDFDLYKGCRDFFSTYRLADINTGRIYSDKLTLHVLQLGKEEYATEEDKAYHIDYWSKLFKSTTWEELRMLAEKQKTLQSTIETMYRANADDYIRAELEAREDQLIVQRSIQEAHEEEVAALKSKIDVIHAEKDAALAEIARLRALLENK